MTLHVLDKNAVAGRTLCSFQDKMLLIVLFVLPLQCGCIKYKWKVARRYTRPSIPSNAVTVLFKYYIAFMHIRSQKTHKCLIKISACSLWRNIQLYSWWIKYNNVKTIPRQWTFMRYRKGVKGYEKFQDSLSIQQELWCPNTSILLLTFH